MKIALDIRKIGMGATGDEVYITNLVLNLAKIDSENQYYLCSNSAEGVGRAERILGDLPANFHFVYLTPKGKLFWTKYSLPRFVRKEKIDLVHVQYITPSRLPKHTKLVTTIHDISFERFPGYISFADRVLLRYFIPESVRRADRVIAVSEFTRDEIVDVYKADKKKVTAIYNGSSEGKFKTVDGFAPDFLERIKTKYGLTNRYIFHVSTLQPRKNVPALIEAYRAYINSYNDPDTLLVIAGGRAHNYDTNIDSYFQDLKLQRRVKMVGYVKDEDLPALYALASVYVSPSSYEGFDLPLVESMISGVPVVASDIPCHREIAGSAGALVDMADTRAASDALHKFLNNAEARTRAVHEGIERSAQFTWALAAKQTLALYKEVAKEKEVVQ